VFRALGAPRLHFFDFWTPQNAIEKTTIFRHGTKSIKSMKKSTFGAPGVDVAPFFIKLWNHFGIAFLTFSEMAKTMNSLHRA